MDTSRHLPLFIAECRELLQSLGAGLLELESSPAEQQVIDSVFRNAHSLKGMSSTMGFGSMAELTHRVEHVLDLVRSGQQAADEAHVTALLACIDQLEAAVDDIDGGGDGSFDIGPLAQRLLAVVRAGDADDAALVLEVLAMEEHTETAEPDERAIEPGEGPVIEVDGKSTPTTTAALPRSSGTVRIEAGRLDRLVQLVGEVVAGRTNVETLVREGNVAAATRVLRDMRHSTQALQAEVMDVRMVPLEAVFSRMPRLVRDLAARLERNVKLVVEGGDTKVDRSIADALGEPLVHLVRNAIDHGIEPPSQRRASGKAEQAILRVSVQRSRADVVITVEDDGRGVDVALVGQRAVERGLVEQALAGALSMPAAIEILYAPGFSTVAEATDISGRGVGLDVVRATCRALGGDAVMESKPGRGSRAQLIVPLTLSAMNVLIVEAGGQRVAIPIDHVERAVRLRDGELTSHGPREMLKLGRETLPVVDLGERLGFVREHDPRFGVIVHDGAGQRCVASVGRLVGEHEAVMRPLPRISADPSRFVGAAIQQDGSVLLIVDGAKLCDDGAVSRSETGAGSTRR